MASLFFLLSMLLTARVRGNVILGRQTNATTGDKQCTTYMCISATVNGPNMEYVLSGRGQQPLGWMGMGFGQQMANTPMVIMWSNADGTITLSQRSAPREVMPTVDPNPPRLATLSKTLSSISGSSSSFGYTISTNGDTKQSVIYAYGTEAPSSSAVDATLVQHLDSGALQLDLARGLSISSSPGSSPASSGGLSPSDDIPLLPYQRLIVAHAIFCILGFLLFLPAGALLARYSRTFTPTWFTGHWIFQFAIAGPAITIGVALGIRSIDKAGALHLNDNHKKIGVTLFTLYFLQCALGAIIHWVKPIKSTRRPLQNYAHAVVGLLIITLALYQVHLGYKVEWPQVTGRGDVSNGADIIFYIWVALLPVLYIAGLSFLPKQLRQESMDRQKVIVTVDDETDVHRDGYRDEGL